VKRSEARPPARTRRRVLVVTLLLGLLLFVWQLGSTGLVDETPPLFAAAARAMAETGDWLVPRVNGLPRYDKPPLVYWLMGLGYALPGQSWWNPLGTWAARLPSALATVAVMLALADTLLRWPQPGPAGRAAFALPGAPAGGDTAKGGTALAAALAFALSPLVLLWGRSAVSDALFTAMVALSLLLAWRTYADPAGRWWHAWFVLGLAVLAKGPVAVVLMGLTLLPFGALQADLAGLLARLRVLKGLLLTALVAVPWYALTLAVEGRPFWDSFFGYHNLQRFTTVVNDHLQPWWFFLPVLVIASLPATPLLLLALGRSLGPLRAQPPSLSLGRFCACWLLAVFVFFSVAATKLPSYWLPATPAAAVLIALAAAPTPPGGDRLERLAWRSTLALALVIAAILLAGPFWVGWIQDPEMPTLPAELLASGRLPLAAAFWLAAAVAGLWAARRRPPLRLLALQLPLVFFVPAALLPLASLGDRLRARPVREMAAAAARQLRPGEHLAMVGILKPSLHYYARHVVVYEGTSPGALVNLTERLGQERRDGQVPSRSEQVPSVLVVIDQSTAGRPHWQELAPEELDRSGLYRLWRLDRRRLEERADRLRGEEYRPDWQEPRPERY
jgi:4-amino-4-deoxy-L-arabinose transferase-like glycosyltransferase